MMRVGQYELGTANPPPPAYAEQVVTDGMNPNREYIPPYSGYAKGQNTSAFLQRRKNVGATTAAYYQVVVGNNYQSPNNCGNHARCTLGGWLTANGWNNDGTPKNGKEARTVFLNNNDLGYVRDMHCLSKDIDKDVVSESLVACWVTNYSVANQEVPGPPFAFPPKPDPNQLSTHFTNAEQTPPDGTTAKATVNMEYRIIPGVNGGAPVVTFIAYGDPMGGKLKDAPIVEGSDQDGFGDKAVPGMCNNCHGGGNFTGNADVQGNFIVFDLSTFLFSKDNRWTRAGLEPAFKQQNAAVLATQPSSAVRELIEGWYGGPKLPNATANDEFVPPGWIGADIIPGKLSRKRLYLNVVRTCRTCHTAIPRQNPRTGISWNTYAQFQNQVQSRTEFTEVCGVQADRDMPHDAISYLNFWRFVPPSLPDYPMGGPGAPASTKMMQPFMDMGAFLDATVKGSNGACENSKGRPPQ
jgi:hypothetical protein